MARHFSLLSSRRSFIWLLTLLAIALPSLVGAQTTPFVIRGVSGTQVLAQDWWDDGHTKPALLSFTVENTTTQSQTLQVASGCSWFAFIGEDPDYGDPVWEPFACENQANGASNALVGPGQSITVSVRLRVWVDGSETDDVWLQVWPGVAGSTPGTNADYVAAHTVWTPPGSLTSSLTVSTFKPRWIPKTYTASSKIEHTAQRLDMSLTNDGSGNATFALQAQCSGGITNCSLSTTAVAVNPGGLGSAYLTYTAGDAGTNGTIKVIATGPQQRNGITQADTQAVTVPFIVKPDLNAPTVWASPTGEVDEDGSMLVTHRDTAIVVTACDDDGTIQDGGLKLNNVLITPRSVVDATISGCKDAKKGTYVLPFTPGRNNYVQVWATDAAQHTGWFEQYYSYEESQDLKPRVTMPHRVTEVAINRTTTDTILVSNTSSLPATYSLTISCYLNVPQGTCSPSMQTSVAVPAGSSVKVPFTFATSGVGAPGPKLDITLIAGYLSTMNQSSFGWVRDTVNLAPIIPPRVVITPASGTQVFEPFISFSATICDEDDGVGPTYFEWQGQPLGPPWRNSAAMLPGCANAVKYDWVNVPIVPFTQTFLARATDFAGHVTTTTAAFTYLAPMSVYKPTITPKRSSQNVAPNVQRSETFTVTNSGIYPVTYSLTGSCGQLPNCSVSPASLALNPGQSGTAAVSYYSQLQAGQRDTLRLIAAYAAPVGAVIADTGRKQVVVPAVEAPPVVGPKAYSLGPTGPGGLSIIGFGVTNPGSEPVTYSLQTYATGGFGVYDLRDTVTVAGGQTETVQVRTSIPTSGGAIGSFILKASYVTIDGRTLSDSGSMTQWTVSSRPGLSIEPGGPIVLSPGQTSVNFFVQNYDAAKPTRVEATVECSGMLVNCSLGSYPPNSYILQLGWAGSDSARKTLPLQFQLGTGAGRSGTIRLHVTAIDGSIVSADSTIQVSLPGPVPLVKPKNQDAHIKSGRSMQRTFSVKNVGTSDGQFTIKALCAGAGVSCPDSVIEGVTLRKNDSLVIDVRAASGPLNSIGAIRLIAQLADSSIRDTGIVTVYVDTIADILVDAKTPSAGATRDRGGCLTIAVGPSAAYECGDLRIVHALPTTTTLNVARTPTLIYDSRQQSGIVLVPADVAINGSAVTSIKAKVTLSGHPGEFRTFPWNPSWSDGKPRRIVIPVDARGMGLATGVHAYSLEVTASDTTLVGTDSGKVAFVNRASSEFGAGWWLDGLEQLFDVDATHKLWVGGDGSSRLYTKLNAAVWTVQPTLDRPDSLVYEAPFWKRRLRNGAFVRFDATGHHVATVSATGQVTAFYHDDAAHSDRVTSIELPIPTAGGVSPSSRRYSFVYAAPTPEGDSVLSQVVAPPAGSAPRIIIIGHEAGSRNVSEISGPDSTAVTFAYSDVGGRRQLTSRTDRRHFTVTFGFDATANVLTQSSLDMKGDANIVNTFCPAEAATLIACASGPLDTAKVRTTFDGPRGDVGDTTHFSLTRYGAPSSIVDALGRVTSIARTDSTWPLLVTSVIAPGGFRREAAYNARGLLTRGTLNNPFGSGDAMTQYIWDDASPFDHLLQIISPLNAVTSFGYFPNGDRQWQRNPGVDSTAFTYNADRQVHTISEPGGPSRLVTTLDYDAKGNLSQTISPKGYVSTIVRDALGRDSVTTRPVDDSQTYLRRTWSLYDLFDRPVSVMDSAATSATDPTTLKLTVTTTYDNEGHPTRVARLSSPDPASIGSVVTTFTYDGAGRRTEEGSENRAQPQWIYDAAGNVLKDGHGDATMEYDALNRVVKRLGTTRDSLAYDAAGNLKSATNAYAKVERTYYPGGALKTDTLRIAAVDTTTPGYGHVYGTRYRYDNDGRLIELFHPNNLRPTSGTSTTYNFDQNTGQVTDIVDIFGQWYHYRYDNAGRQSSFIRRYGQADSVSETTTYDLNGRLQTRNQRDASGTALHSDFLIYDAQDRITSASNGDIGAYDGLGHLLKSTVRGHQETFTSDAHGNQIQHTDLGSQASTETFVYEPGTGKLLKRLSKGAQLDPDTTWYIYDDVSGNRLQTRDSIQLSGRTQYDEPRFVRKVRTDGYDRANRLVWSQLAVDTVPESSLPRPTYVSTEFYRYDALGRRIWRETLKPSTCPQVERETGCRNTVTRFVWSGADLLYEIAASATDPEDDAPAFGAHYGVIGYTHDGAVDQPIGVFKVGVQNVLPLADWRGQYDKGMCGSALCGTAIYFPGSGASAYGRFNRADGPPSWYGSLIEGHQDGSGYQYRRNRYYDPVSGNFTQQDPIGLAGGLNLYGFAAGDPVNYTDPFGLCPVEKPLCQWIEATSMAIGSLGGFVGGGGGGALVAALTGGVGAPAIPAGAWAGAGVGAVGGLAVGKAITGVLFSEASDGGQSGDRQGAQDKVLGGGEIRRLQRGGEDIHQIKADALGTNKNLSKFDLFKTRDGDIVVKLKNGTGESHPTGLNISRY